MKQRFTFLMLCICMAIYANGQSLSVSPQVITATPESWYANFTVETTADWVASSDQPWCTVPPSGSGSGILSASYEANMTLLTRTAMIVVTIPGPVTDTVYVEQFGLLPPQDLQTSVTANANVHLSWSPPDNSNGIIGYHVYKNGFRITAAPVTSLYFDDQGLNPGTYEYRVSSVYFTIESSLSDPAQAAISGYSIVGDGALTCGYPYYTFYMGSRTQMIYTADRLTAAGMGAGQILSVGFNISSYSSQVMTNFTIKIGHTTVTNISNWIPDGLTIVYQYNYGVTGIGWQDIFLDTPFNWNGTDNLVVEICFGDMGYYTANSIMYGSDIAGKVWHYHADNYAGCIGAAAGSAQSVLPNIRFGMIPGNVGIVTGTVRDASDNSPLSQALVTIPPATATTDENGTYVCFAVPAGLHTVAVSGEGYPPFSDTCMAIANAVRTKDLALPPGAHLTGMIINAATGTPLTGAVVEIGGISGMSVEGGSYLTPMIPLTGFLPLSVSKPGYDTYVDTLSVTTDTTYYNDISLRPATYPPGEVVATLDNPLTPLMVNLNWSPPAPVYESIFDDGTQEDFMVWDVTNNLNAVRFTPAAWPCLLLGGKINIGEAENYTVPLEQMYNSFTIMIYLADGPGGLPGTRVAITYASISSFGWISFSLPGPVQITSGDFYIIMEQWGEIPYAAGIAVDMTTPQGRSFSHDLYNGTPWAQAPGNFMMRAVLQGTGGIPYLPGDQPAITSAVSREPAAGKDAAMVPGILNYRINRLLQGEEEADSLWSFLGMTNLTSFSDYNWATLPDGAYRWAVQAIYEPDQRPSLPSFSNVLGKNWVTEVTVCVTLSCSENSLEGTSVTLTNLQSPDTLYRAFTGPDGCVTFTNIWKGEYELKVNRFQYTLQTQSISAYNSPSYSISMMKEAQPVTNLQVDPLTLQSSWQPPRTSVYQLNETWNDYALNQWTFDGGNWTVDYSYGNPAPAARFNYYPEVLNYDQYLTSKVLSGQNAPVQLLKYDIYLAIYGTTYENNMAVELWDGTAWSVLKSYSTNSYGILWTTETLDITNVTDNDQFRIRFHAYGQDSYELDNWMIDNVQVIGSDGNNSVDPCVMGYHFFLNDDWITTTPDTIYTISPALIQYGYNYQICVEVEYEGINSMQVCTPFTSQYLYPPRDFAGIGTNNAMYMTWIPPLITSGLTGYNIYRNGMKLNYNPVTDLYYVDQGVPAGNYAYLVKALYELTPYGYPGSMAESMPAGPLMAGITGMPSAPAITAGNAGAPYNADVLVPLTVLGFDKITGFTLRLDYDPVQLTFSGSVNVIPELAGLTANAWPVSPGNYKVLITWNGSSPVSLLPGMKVADLHFTYHAGTPPLSWNNNLPGGDECVWYGPDGDSIPDLPTSLHYIDGSVHWEQGYSIGGTFRYNNPAMTPLDNIKVLLSQGSTKIDSTLTNATGQYSFTDIINGTYEMSARSVKPWQGVNSTDALKIQRHFTGLEVITEPVRLLAADVNNNHAINSTDALKVKRRFIGLDNGFPRGDWTFAMPAPGGLSVVVNNSDVTQNYYGLCVGDVNGSGTPSPGKISTPAVSLQNDWMMEVSAGETVDVPVILRSATDVGALSLVLPDQPSKVILVDASAPSGDMMFHQTGGDLRFAWSETDPIRIGRDEELMTLRMKVSEQLSSGELVRFAVTDECEISDGGGRPVFPAIIAMPVLKVIERDESSGNKLSAFLFPNPADDHLMVSCFLQNEARLTYELVSVYGQTLLKAHSDNPLRGKVQEHFNISGFPPGLYLFRITAAAESGEYSGTMRLVIHR